jgi:SAM-dependent methyltransferase
VFPVVNGIPRFVPEENYATSFGLQWNRYRTVQLDSHTGTSISRDRLTRLLGGNLDAVRGKTVLEAGCGAGRFSEILLGQGAELFAVDLSTAVEANYETCRKYPGYFVCQADILRLPFPPARFDVVLCIGVVQHTPEPEATIAALCRQVAPGGTLVMDHYTLEYPMPASSRVLRAALLHLPGDCAMRFSEALVSFLWPFHRAARAVNRVPVVKWLARQMLALSPVVDYHGAYPQLGPELLRSWAILDTHDTLTDRYKHLRSAQDIEATLRACGMVDIETACAGNGVEARARKPVAPAPGDPPEAKP